MPFDPKTSALFSVVIDVISQKATSETTEADVSYFHLKYAMHTETIFRKLLQSLNQPSMMA